MNKRRLAEADRLERDATRRAKRARTDLAEAVDDERAAGADLADIAAVTGRPVDELQELLSAEKRRLYARRYARQRTAAVLSGAADPYHGTTEGILVGCRCDECNQERARRRQRESRDRATGLPPGDPRHGTPRGFDSFGCRCELCRAAKHTKYDPAKEAAKYRRRMAALTPEQHEELKAKYRERNRRRREAREPKEK